MLVGVAPFLIPALWNIDILHYKQAKLHKDIQHSVCVPAALASTRQSPE